MIRTAFLSAIILRIAAYAWPFKLTLEIGTAGSPDGVTASNAVKGTAPRRHSSTGLERLLTVTM